MIIETLFATTEVTGKNLRDPRMTTENNPLAAPRDPSVAIENRNMDRLINDAHMRKCPVNGHVYSGIMSMRYKGE